MNSIIKISIIIPCFNEEESINTFYHKLCDNLPENYQYEILFVNDGSYDRTLDIIKLIVEKDNRVRYISFSRNFGHQAALKAGYDHVTGDCAICLDADLQHPPELIQIFIEKWKEGYEVVNSIRKYGDNISSFKKISSSSFYKLLNNLSDTKINPGMADFRLIDRKVLDQLKLFNEQHIFYRGLISWLGFRQVNVEYQAGDRYAGVSKYTMKRMMKFASHGITSFSTKPLRFSIYLGLLFAAFAFGYGLYALCIYLFTEKAVTGWTSTIVSIMFVGGINLLMLGIIGEYLGKMFIENKKRPHYLISETNIS